MMKSVAILLFVLLGGSNALSQALSWTKPPEKLPNYAIEINAGFDCEVTGAAPGYTITWTAQRGTFPNGSTGTAVRYVAPTTPGMDSITVKSTHNILGTFTSITRGVEVIRLDKVRIGIKGSFGNGQTHGMPQVDQEVTLRALVWATCVDQKVYTSESHSGGSWLAPGTNGPMAVRDVAPAIDVRSVERWPGHWPALTLVWKRQYHDCTAKHRSTSDRMYDYTEDSPPDWGQGTFQTAVPWGYTGFFNSGTFRAKVGAKLPVQEVYSPEGENALRISVRSLAPQDRHGRDYVRYLFAHLEVAYEWGGDWFGGKRSPDTWAGGGVPYEGYGIDCSGFITIGAWFTGYSWAGTNQTTVSLNNSHSSRITSLDEVRVGDIVLLISEEGNHVRAIYRIDPGDADEGPLLYCIGAEGGDATNNSKVRTVGGQTFRAYERAGYTIRRLNP